MLKVIAMFMFSFLALAAAGTVDAGGSRRNAPKEALTSATLTWEAPTKNTDGTPISSLAGYKIYYDTVSQGYRNKQPKITVTLEDSGLCCKKIGDNKKPDEKQARQVKLEQQKKKQDQPDKTECTYTISDLDPGTHYFAVRAYSRSGAESDFSNEAKK